MSPDFGSAVVAILGREEGKPVLLGSGVVLSRKVILTCDHLFHETRRTEEREWLPDEVTVQCGNVALRPLRIQKSEPLDLCCLHFDTIPGTVPVKLARTRKLQGMRVTTVGYKTHDNSPRRDITHSAKVIHDLHSDGLPHLQCGQLQGGMPKGFSGGPVLITVRNERLMVGMLQHGGEEASTSSFIAADRIASFLNEKGVQIAVYEVPLEEKPAKLDATAPGGTVLNKKTLINSAVIDGATINHSVVQQTVAPDRDVPDTRWESLETLMSELAHDRNGSSVARLKKLVRSGRKDEAHSLWCSIRPVLAAAPGTKRVLELFDSLFSKG